MSQSKHQRSGEDDALLQRIFGLLKIRTSANPYGRDGAFAKEIGQLPVGLRAMAATHHLDISLTLDDIGWHFLNFGEENHVRETNLGLLELGLPEVAQLFREAYEIVKPHLCDLHQPEADYYKLMEQTSHMKRIDELTGKARRLLGEGGIYTSWVDYAKRHPDRVFKTA